MTNPHYTLPTLVPEQRRMDFLPAMFDRYFLPGETALFNAAACYLGGYQGGLWDFYEAGDVRYAVPIQTDRWAVSVPGNYFEGEVSADAAGIICSMFALNAMAAFAHERRDGEATDFLADAYHALRRYACEHPEARAILSAID
ncbi:hypothetical protein QFZ99_006062 [Paraburkholderia atlantica]|uniref:antirestriction protein n=1 Tax=Paraburkholderia atlantica TaxID=2654982 RepID=UPI003D1B9EA6